MEVGGQKPQKLGCRATSQRAASCTVAPRRSGFCASRVYLAPTFYSFSELLAASFSQPNSLWLLAVGLPRPNLLSGGEACRQPSRDIGLGGDTIPGAHPHST